MKEKNNNGFSNLQSRREFFKEAAKGALPIIAATVLVSVPTIVKAVENAPTGCNWGSCSVTCQGTCSGTCATSCYNSCPNQCTSCTGGCRNSCWGCTGGCLRSCHVTCLGTNS